MLTTLPSIDHRVDPEKDEITLDGSASREEDGNFDDRKAGRSEEDVVPVPAVAGPAPPEFVEGGLRGVLNVVGAFLTLFITFGYSNAFGVYQEYYLREKYQNESASNIAWVGSIQLWCMFTASVIVGMLYDKGYFRYLMVGGSVFYVFSMFMTSLCKQFWQTVLAQGFGVGISTGMMFLPAMSVLSQNWKRRRALAMGVATSGSSIGGVCFPIMLNKLFARMSFGSAVRASGFLVLGCCVAINLLMHANPPAPKPPGFVKPNPLKFFREPRYAVACFGAFFVALGIFVPIFYIQLFLAVNNVDATITYYSLAILNGGSVVGRVAPSFIADTYGPFNLLIPTCICAGAIVFVMFAATSSAGAIIFCLLYGLFSGGYVSLLGPVFASTATNFSEIGVRMGLPFTVLGVAALAGSPIAGQLLSKTPQTFLAPILFAGCSMLFGSCSLMYARILQSRLKGTWRV